MLMTLWKGRHRDARGRSEFMQSSVRVTAVLALAGTLAACGHAPKTMYDWKSYQPTVYRYLVDDGGDYVAQAETLKSNIETSRSANTVLPPGFRAHLGMLYLKMGEDEKAIEQLEGEKLAFPESAPFMAFLMRNVAVATMPPSSDKSPNGALPVDDKLLTKTVTD